MDSMTQIILICISIILVFLSSFFSAAETAYSSISPTKLRSFVSSGKKSAKLIDKHYKSFGWTLATILISNNLVNIGSSSLTTYLFTDLLGTSSMVTIVSTLVVTPVIVIFGEIIPKILAKKYSLGYLKKIVYIMEFLNWLFFPITFPLSKIALQSNITNTEKEIKNIISLAREEGILEANEATLAQKALDLDSKIVRQIMTPEKKIISIKKSATIKEAKELFIKTGHSRLLVKEKGKYVGILIFKDIAFKTDSQKISPNIVDLKTVSQSVLVTRALEKMRIEKSHLALVVQSKSSTKPVGIVTLEDVMEELVGEIYDEHDAIEPIREIAHHKYIAYGSAKVEDIEHEIDFELERNESDDISIKQWIQSRINRKIRKKLRYEYKDKIVFKIIKNKNKEETIIEITKKMG